MRKCLLWGSYLFGRAGHISVVLKLVVRTYALLSCLHGFTVGLCRYVPKNSFQIRRCSYSSE